MIALAAIDNLWKGAAGQAVQDLNLMLGLPGDGGARMSERIAPAPSSAPAGSSAPGHVTRARPAPACPRASARPGWRPGSSREGLDVGVVCVGRAGHGVRRPLHHQRARGRARDRLAQAPRSTGCGRWWRTPAARTSATGERGIETAVAMQQAAAEALGRGGGPGGRGLDRRDRHGAAAREGGGRRARGLRSARPATRTTFSRRDPHERRRPEAGLPRGDARGGHGAARRPGQGRRDDLAAPRDDVLLHPDGRRLWPRTRSTCSPACA